LCVAILTIRAGVIGGVTARYACVINAGEAVITVAVGTTACNTHKVNRVAELTLSALIAVDAGLVNAHALHRVTDEVTLTAPLAAALTTAPIGGVAIVAHAWAVEVLAVYIELTAERTGVVITASSVEEELTSLRLALLSGGRLNAHLRVVARHTTGAVRYTGAALRVTEQGATLSVGLAGTGVTYTTACLTHRLRVTKSALGASVVTLTGGERAGVGLGVTDLARFTAVASLTAPFYTHALKGVGGKVTILGGIAVIINKAGA
jgi:hypothetical protein